MDIYDLLKPFFNYIKAELVFKHICIYYINYMDKIDKIYNIITSNIITKEDFLEIKNKTYQPGKLIDSPIVLLNKKLNDYNKFVRVMKGIFYNNMRLKDSNINDIEIYYCVDIDILNLNICQTKILKLDEVLFLLYISPLEHPTNNIIYNRFLIVYEIKNS